MTPSHCRFRFSWETPTTTSTTTTTRESIRFLSYLSPSFPLLSHLSISSHNTDTRPCPRISAESPQIGVEIPLDSDEADQENRKGGRTLLNILGHGCAAAAALLVNAREALRSLLFVGV